MTMHKQTQMLKYLAIFCLALGSMGAHASYDTTIAADGSEVKDSVTGLIWRRCAEGMVWSGSTCTGLEAFYTHEEALLRAKAEAASSGKAWRVPNVKELLTISKIGVSASPSIDTTAFPAATSNLFWTSSPYVGLPSSAWFVQFQDGSIGPSARSSTFFVRLVR